VGDVDRDGKLDIVTADAGSGTASVLTNAGSGSFSVLQTAAVGVKPVRVRLVDLDRDGRLDLAALDELGSGTPQVTVLSPTGSLSSLFQPSATVPLTVNAHALGLAVGDLVRDGRPDLVVTEQAANQVVVVANIAGPDCVRSSFGEAPRGVHAGDGPVAVAVADFDEDGTEDLVAAATYSGTLEVLRGSGGIYEPTLSLPLPLAPAPPPRAVATADFNVDGHADIVAGLGNGTAGQVQIFLGDGTGGLVAQPPLTAGTNVSAVVTGDFNGDGAPDVALTSQVDNRVEVYLGDGLGGLSGPTTISLPAGAAPQALAAGDLDGNSTLDLVVAHSGSNVVTVLLGHGDGTFTAAVGSPLTVGPAPWGVALGDFDGNGVLDIVTANNGSSSLTVLLGTGGGAFGAPTTLTVDGAPIAVVARDVNGDAKVDVAAVTATNTLNLLAGNGAGSFAAATIHPVQTRPSAVVPVDADADGRLDLAVPCRDADTVVLLLARPPGFAAATRVPVGSMPTATSPSSTPRGTRCRSSRTTGAATSPRTRRSCPSASARRRSWPPTSTATGGSTSR
jgi:hypothetical protein